MELTLYEIELELQSIERTLKIIKADPNMKREKRDEMRTKLQIAQQVFIDKYWEQIDAIAQEQVKKSMLTVKK